jgi:hypothetical protein
LTLPNTCVSSAPIYSWFDSDGVANITNIAALVPSYVLTRSDIGRVVYGSVQCGESAPATTYGPFTLPSGDFPPTGPANKYSSTVGYKYVPGTASGSFPLVSYYQPAWRVAGEYLGAPAYLWYGYTISGGLTLLAYSPISFGGGTIQFENGNTSSENGSNVVDIRDPYTDAVLYTYPQP